MDEFAPQDGEHLRLIWPQWQGGGTSSVREFAAEFPFAVGRRGYAVGSAVLEAVLPSHPGPSATGPVAMTDEGLEERDGVEAKTIILDQFARAFGVIDRYRPAKITTLGGECSVSAEPDGLTSAEVRRILDDVGRVAEVVGLTIAEFIPRQVMQLQQILTDFPLLGGSTPPRFSAADELAGRAAKEGRACPEH